MNITNFITKIKNHLFHKETLFLFFLFLVVVSIGVGITLLQNANKTSQQNIAAPQKPVRFAMPPALTPIPGQKNLIPVFDTAAGATTLTNCDVADSDIAMDDQEQAFLALINNYRQANGVGPLTPSLNLSRAAAEKVIDMVKQGTMPSHTDTSQRLYNVRIADCGYTVAASGENIAAGTLMSTAQSAFDGWRTACDPDATTGVCTYEHNKNMLDSRYQAIGIARHNDPSSVFTWYWATDFGEATDGTTVPTTNGATITPSPTATPTATLTPTATPSATPSTISASPNPCAIQPGQNSCSSTITFGATSTPDVVCVNTGDGSGDHLFYGSTTSGGTEVAPWIGAGVNYIFTLYQQACGGTVDARILVTATGGSVVSPTPTTQVSVFQLSFTVALEGYGFTGTAQQPKLSAIHVPRSSSRSFEVDVLDATGKQIAQKNPTFSFLRDAGVFNGTLAFYSLPPGKYGLKIKTFSFLAKTIPGGFTAPVATGSGITASSLLNPLTITLPVATLSAGDINGDNVVDVRDYNILADCFDTTYPTNYSLSRFNSQACINHPESANADINDDGLINELDYELLYANAGKKGD